MLRKLLILLVLFTAACGTPTPQGLLPTVAVLPSLTATLTDVPTMTPSATPLPSATPSPSTTPSPSVTPSPSPSPTPSFTPTDTLTPTPVYAQLGTLVGTLETTMGAAFVSGFERHIYTLDGHAGEWVTLAVESDNPAVDPVVTLYDPLGNPLALDDDSGDNRAALLRNVRLPVDGVYFVQTVGGGYGRYTVHLTRSSGAPLITPIPASPTATPPIGTVTPAPANGRTLRDHVPVTAVLEPQGMARYFIRVEAGAVLTIGARALAPSANLRIEVFNPAGELQITLNETTSGTDGDTIVPMLGVIEAGIYTIILTDDARIGGAYTISYGLGYSHSDVLRGMAAPETDLRGNVERRGLRDVWSLTLNQGDHVALSLLVDNPAFSALVRLVAPDGTVVAGLSTTPAATSVDDILIATSGTYLLQIEGDMVRTYGSYTLRWRYVQQGATPTPVAGLVPVMRVEDTVLARTSPLYPFQGRAGDHVRIRVLGVDGFDPLALLLAPDRTSLMGSDDVDGLNPVIDYVLPADGTYFVEIGGYGGTGGTMQLIVERWE